MAKYDLSVAIIFKNEIRCLERCLKSLQPLREHLSMEIVMADTGSDDGSEKVAAKYADILFDFPWINDFSAARNAVLERCSGRWILAMDADTWLDKDVGPLVKQVMRQPEPDCDYCLLTGRNYITRNLDSYTISLTSALLRTASDPHYVGAIHETPAFGPERRAGRGLVNQYIIIHHDGYVMLNDGSKAGQKKLERNLDLIRKELEKDPDNLRTLGEYLDCAGGEEDFMDTVRHAVELVKETKDMGQGPGLMRRAVQAAYVRGLPEWEEWAQQARELFPDDHLVRVDVSFLALSALLKENRLKEALPWCREYLRGKRKFEEDTRGTRAVILSSMMYGSDGAECTVRMALAHARTSTCDYEGAYAALKDIKFEALPVDRVGFALMTCVELFLLTDFEFSSLMIQFWEGIQTAAISEKHASDRVAVFLSEGQDYFDLSKSAKRGTLLSTGARQPWEIFAPLVGRCILGDAAALFQCETAAEADAVLASAGDLNEIPLQALGHVIRLGAKFPPRPLTIEEADILAARLVQNVADYPALAIAASKRLEDGQGILWARGLALAATQKFDWSAKDANALPLARAFAEIEDAYLTYCYTPAALAELGMLPPMHRFGCHCVRAFAALDAGDYTGCVRALRDGLSAAPDRKEMVEYLLAATEAEHVRNARKNASPELKQLAEQIRAILANYPANDPAVTELKKSPAYQKVAYLIEG